MTHKKKTPATGLLRSVWGLRILMIVSILVTGIMALMRSHRVYWMVLVSLLVILLNAVNSVRVRSMFRKKPLRGTGHIRAKE